MELILAPQELFHVWGVPLVTALCCLIKLHYTEAVQFEQELAAPAYLFIPIHICLLLRVCDLLS